MHRVYSKIKKYIPVYNKKLKEKKLAQQTEALRNVLKVHKQYTLEFTTRKPFLTKNSFPPRKLVAQITNNMFIQMCNPYDISAEYSLYYVL